MGARAFSMQALQNMDGGQDRVGRSTVRACGGPVPPWVALDRGLWVCLIIRAAMELSRKAPDELLVMIEVEVRARRRRSARTDHSQCSGSAAPFGDRTVQSPGAVHS